LSETKQLVSIQERLKQQFAAQNDRMPVTSGSSRVKLAGKLFTLPDGTTSEGPIKAIILDFTFANSFFEGNYNSNKPVPPVCQSRNRNANEMVPAEGVEKPQAAACADCDQNVYPDSGGKPCKNTISIAIVAGDVTDKSSLLTIDVSPTGLTGFNKYIKELSASGLLPIQVVTEISFDPTQSYPKLVFGNPKEHDKLEIAFGHQEKAQKLLG